MECGEGRGGGTIGRAGEEGGGVCVFSGNFLQVVLLQRRDLLHKQPPGEKTKPRHHNVACHLVASAGSEELHHLVAKEHSRRVCSTQVDSVGESCVKIACTFRQNRGFGWSEVRVST